MITTQSVTVPTEVRLGLTHFSLIKQNRDRGHCNNLVLFTLQLFDKLQLLLYCVHWNVRKTFFRSDKNDITELSVLFQEFEHCSTLYNKDYIYTSKTHVQGVLTSSVIITVDIV